MSSFYIHRVVIKALNWSSQNWFEKSYVLSIATRSSSFFCSSLYLILWSTLIFIDFHMSSLVSLSLSCFICWVPDVTWHLLVKTLHNLTHCSYWQDRFIEHRFSVFRTNVCDFWPEKQQKQKFYLHNLCFMMNKPTSFQVFKLTISTSCRL